MPVALLIPLISALVPVANNLIQWIEQARTAAGQSAELTPEQLDALAQIDNDMNWTVVPDPAPPQS